MILKVLWFEGFSWFRRRDYLLLLFFVGIGLPWFRLGFWFLEFWLIGFHLPRPLPKLTFCIVSIRPLNLSSSIPFLRRKSSHFPIFPQKSIIFVRHRVSTSFLVVDLHEAVYCFLTWYFNNPWLSTFLTVLPSQLKKNRIHRQTHGKRSSDNMASTTMMTMTICSMCEIGVMRGLLFGRLPTLLGQVV